VRRVLTVAVLLLASASAAIAAEAAEPSIWWKWANFALLAGALGFLIGKNAPAFFRSRNDAITRGIAAAAQEKEEADERLAEIEKRMAGLESEIATLRSASREELAQESARVEDETARQGARLRALNEQEIAAAVKAARQELKVYSAELALGLAEKRLRTDLTEEFDRRLVRAYIADLNRQKPAREVQ
jgi:F-type H+-transporting ATPase subunit b